MEEIRKRCITCTKYQFYLKKYSKEPKHLSMKEIQHCLNTKNKYGVSKWNVLRNLIGMGGSGKQRNIEDVKGTGETKGETKECMTTSKGEEDEIPEEQDEIPMVYLCRFAALLNLNNKLRSLLPLIDLSLERSVCIDVVHETKLMTKNNNNLQKNQLHKTKGFQSLSGYGEQAALLREIIFYDTKNHFWRSVLYHTTTKTIPPQGEGDKPESIPRISVNRISAGREKLEKTVKSNLKMKGLKDIDAFQAVFEQSVLGQLMNELEGRHSRNTARLLRRAWEDVQDAGQERAFYVQFMGEGVSDHGGPYRAIFQKACAEEPSILGLVKECGKGGKTDNLIELAHTKRTETRGSEYEASQLSKIKFLGKLIGTAVRHRIMIPMDFACNVWYPLVGRSLSTSKSLSEIDKVFELSLKELELKIETPIPSKKEEFQL